MPFDGSRLPEIGRADVLRRAADILDQGGWCRWTLIDDRGAHCLIGAIFCARRIPALGAPPEHSQVEVHRDAELVCETLGLPFVSTPRTVRSAWSVVVQWNNETAQSGAQVAKALRDTADRLEVEALSRK